MTAQMAHKDGSYNLLPRHELQSTAPSNPFLALALDKQARLGGEAQPLPWTMQPKPLCFSSGIVRPWMRETCAVKKQLLVLQQVVSREGAEESRTA